MDLYKVDNNGNLRVWSITLNTEARIYPIIIIHHGRVMGAMQVEEELIEEGKAGRSLLEQAQSRYDSRVNKQLDRGYRHTPDEAYANKGKNKLDTYAPMLAQNSDKVKKWDPTGAVIQRKLDGNRMLVTRQDGELFAYTRNGKRVTTLDHILLDLSNLREGQTIDGEVYIHGMALKDINSRMRKKQLGTLDLKYHVYDTIDDRPFKERFKDILDLQLGTNIIKEHHWDYDTIDIDSFHDSIVKSGYEGLILRLDNYGYEAGKRSRGLLKIKKRHDAEAKVIDIELARSGGAVLVLRMPSGKVFKTLPPGNKLQKRHVLANQDEYIGKDLTYSYAYITDYGIPFHAVAERWRTQ